MADALEQAQHQSDIGFLSSCPAFESATSVSPRSDFLPPAVAWNWLGNSTMHCCGPCAIFVPQVRLAYFPPEPNVPCGQDPPPSTITTAPKVKGKNNAVVSDGFTYRSPSVYFEIVGTASFEDECGALGTKVVTSTVAVPPGFMSTISYDVPVGSALPTGHEAWASRIVKPLDVRDLQCPTWGLAEMIPKTGPNTARVGPPYFPMLVAPQQLLTVDIAWSKCMGNHWPLKYGIFDPPHALIPNTVLGPSESTPTVEPDSESTNDIPEPAQTPSPDMPEPTINPSTNDVPDSSDSTNGQSTNDVIGDPHDEHDLKNPENEAIEESDNPSNPVGNGDPWTVEPDNESNSMLGPGSTPSENEGSDKNSYPTTSGGSEYSTDQEGSAGSTFAASGQEQGDNQFYDRPGANSGASADDEGSPGSIVVAGGQHASDGTYDGAGESGEGHFEGGSSGNNPPEDSDFANGSKQGEEPPPSNVPPGSPPVLTVGGKIYAEHSAGCTCFVMAPGTTLTPGGSITGPGGAKIELASNGAFAVIGGKTQNLVPTPVVLTGSQAYAIPLFTGTARPAVSNDNAVSFSIGTRTFTAKPSPGNKSQFTVYEGDQSIGTLTPGGSTITANGAVVSLDTSGVVKVNGKDVATLSSSKPIDKEVFFSIGTQTFTAKPLPGGKLEYSLFEGKQALGVLTPGGSTVKVNGAIISVDAYGEIEVNGKAVATVPLSKAKEKEAFFSIGTQTFMVKPLPGGKFQYTLYEGDQALGILTPGGSTIKGGGAIVSLSTSGVIEVNGKAVVTHSSGGPSTSAPIQAAATDNAQNASELPSTPTILSASTSSPTSDTFALGKAIATAMSGGPGQSSDTAKPNDAGRVVVSGKPLLALAALMSWLVAY